MGRLHAEKLGRCEGVALAAIVDRDAARAGALAQAHGCAAFADFRDVFGLVDAAVVAVPTDAHFEVASACLENGLHLLIEKPIAQSVEQADRLIAAAERRGRVLQVGHVERWNKAFQALSERMDRPVFVDAERLAGFKQRGAEVDVVLDLMIHDLDLAIALARAEVSETRLHLDSARARAHSAGADGLTTCIVLAGSTFRSSSPSET